MNHALIFFCTVIRTMRFDEKNYYAVSLTSFSAIYSQPKIFVVFCEIN